MVPGYMGPSEAYNALDQFGKRYGRDALVLAIHAAAVPYLTKPLLAALREKFLPDAELESAGDAYYEDAVTGYYAHLCEDPTYGIFAMDGEVRQQSLILLSAHYGHKGSPDKEVAQFILDSKLEPPSGADAYIRKVYAEVDDYNKLAARAVLRPEEAARVIVRKINAAIAQKDNIYYTDVLNDIGAIRATGIALVFNAWADLLRNASGDHDEARSDANYINDFQLTWPGLPEPDAVLRKHGIALASNKAKITPPSP